MSRGSNETLSRDELFDLLSQARRRYVLYYLGNAEGPVDFNTLTEQVAAWENEKPVEELTEKERKRVYVSLYQTHVPKLEDAGLIAYDRDEGVVESTSHAEQIGEYFQESGGGHRWYRYYLTVAVLGLLGYVGAMADVGPLSLVPASIVVGLTIGVILLVVAAQVVVERRARQDSLVEFLRE